VPGEEADVVGFFLLRRAGAVADEGRRRLQTDLQILLELSPGEVGGDNEGGRQRKQGETDQGDEDFPAQFHGDRRQHDGTLGGSREGVPGSRVRGRCASRMPGTVRETYRRPGQNRKKNNTFSAPL